MTLRTALLGCGWIGSEFRTDTPVGIYNHAAAYQACPDTELVAIYTIPIPRSCIEPVSAGR